MDLRAIVPRADRGAAPFPLSRGWLREHPVVTDIVTAAGLASLLLPGTLITLLSLKGTAGWTGPVIVAFAVLHACPALRRTAPTGGYALACLAMLVVVAAPNGQVHGTGPEPPLDFPILFLPSSLVFLPMLHGVAAHPRHRTGPLALVAALLGTGLGMLRTGQAVPSSYPVIQYRSYVGLALLIAVVGAWGLGTATATRARSQALERAEATREAIHAERARIAQDMHDVVAHSVAVTVRLAEAGALVATRSPERAAALLTSIAEVGRDALGDLRGMVGVLRDPHADDRTGPDRTAPPSLDQLPAVLDRVRTTGVEVSLSRTGTAQPLGGTVELAAYHVVREALTNTVKHAGPGARALVELTWGPDRLVVRVEDDGGRRTDPPAARDVETRAPVPGAGAGLAGLRQRVTAAGGTLATGPHAGGYAVRAELPARSRGGRPDGTREEASGRTGNGTETRTETGAGSGTTGGGTG